MKLFILLLNLVLIITVSCKRINPGKIESNSLQDTVNNVTGQSEDSLLSIIVVGDIMMGTNYPNSSSLPPNDGKYLFDDVSDILLSADITCGNLEGTFLNSGGTPKVCKDSGEHCISFRMPEHYASYLKDAGFDFLNLANNHSGDMGIKGRESTSGTLDEYEIYYAGTLDNPTTMLERNGIKFGFAGFAPNKGTCSINDLEKAKEIVTELKSKSDIVIVSFHGGAEGESAQFVPKKNEIFLGENRGDVYEFAHVVIDAGADIVFGHGPHVTRAIELYEGKFIAYSLGNFCTYGKFNLSGSLGIAPIIKVYINKNGDFVKGEITPIQQIKRGVPIIDENKRAIKILRQLTERNFPNTSFEISDKGVISLMK
jgi:poly-gamma-glutamate capsule biosynthesis protein CapA/YwtB (metallophosphatase superfamily)